VMVCLYAMLSGLTRLLVTPGGGVMAGNCENTARICGLGFFRNLVMLGRAACQLGPVLAGAILKVRYEKEEKTRGPALLSNVPSTWNERDKVRSQDPVWRSAFVLKMHVRPCGANLSKPVNGDRLRRVVRPSDRIFR
jgi:hypothetical protein